MQELLEWQDFKQIRWQGEYEILYVAENCFSCQLKHMRFTIEAKHVQVDYFANKGFMLQAKDIAMMQFVVE